MTSHAPLKGIALVITAAVIFAVMDTVAKHLMTKFGVPFVASIRYGLNLVILLVLFTPFHGAKTWATNRTGLTFLRGASLACASFFAGLALQRMPVGEAVSIFYLQGFGVMLAAGFFLKEKISLIGWAAAILGFAGVLLIARPGGALDPLGVAFALTCSVISVVYVLLSRVLAPTETTMAMLFHVAIAGIILFGTLLVANWKQFYVTAHDVPLLGFMGVASLLSHYLLTAAYRFAPASMLAPFGYFHIAFAVLCSWIVYEHVPDTPSFIGMAMIATAGITIALFTHLSKAKVPDHVET